MKRDHAPLILASPQCDVGCGTCTMACAILPSRLAWWENEIRLAHAGDPEAVGLETALHAHEQLTRAYAASPRANAARAARLN